MPLKIAKARAVGKVVFVDKCPYCGGKHEHPRTDSDTRMAHCLQGDYVLDFREDRQRRFKHL